MLFVSSVIYSVKYTILFGQWLSPVLFLNIFGRHRYFLTYSVMPNITGYPRDTHGFLVQCLSRDTHNQVIQLSLKFEKVHSCHLSRDTQNQVTQLSRRFDKIHSCHVSRDTQNQAIQLSWKFWGNWFMSRVQRYPEPGDQLSWKFWGNWFMSRVQSPALKVLGKFINVACPEIPRTRWFRCPEILGRFINVTCPDIPRTRWFLKMLGKIHAWKLYRQMP
jgi:hypothetical protein